ncbi:MAG: hypothetical protein ACRD1Y_11775 [Terriglobales bacterium]
MSTKIPAGAAVLATLLVLAVQFPAQTKAQPYPHMAPVASYLMPRAAEIALARSAAPPAVSAGATVLVLTPRGYVTAAKGSNGFVCFVERSWDSPIHSDTFWNPHLRGADCLNRPAVQSVLPIYLLRTRLALTRRTRAGILTGLRAAVAAHRLPPLAPDSFSFMLSKHSYLTNSGGNLAHVMFFVPAVPSREMGADLPGSPVSLAGRFDLVPVAIFIVSVPQWSDGTPAM